MLSFKKGKGKPGSQPVSGPLALQVHAWPSAWALTEGRGAAQAVHETQEAGMKLHVERLPHLVSWGWSFQANTWPLRTVHLGLPHSTFSTSILRCVTAHAKCHGAAAPLGNKGQLISQASRPGLREIKLSE